MPTIRLFGLALNNSSKAMVYIYSIYSVSKGEYVNGTEKFCVPWAVRLEQFADNFAEAGQQSADGRLKTYLFGHE